MTTPTPAPVSIQRAAAYCRLHMLGDKPGRAAILELANDDGAAGIVGLVEALADLATDVERVGRGRQVVKTRKQALQYFEDLAAVAYGGGAA